MPSIRFFDRPGADVGFSFSFHNSENQCANDGIAIFGNEDEWVFRFGFAWGGGWWGEPGGGNRQGKSGVGMCKVVHYA